MALNNLAPEDKLWAKNEINKIGRTIYLLNKDDTWSKSGMSVCTQVLGDLEFKWGYGKIYYLHHLGPFNSWYGIAEVYDRPLSMKEKSRKASNLK